MKIRPVLVALGIVVAMLAGSMRASAQEDRALKRDIERRFDVLPLRDGLALRPKSDARGVRSIELTDGTIAIDGDPVTGAELRNRLGPEADAVIRLSYLDPSARRRLFGTTGLGNEPPAEIKPAPSTRPAPSRTRRSESRVRVGGNVTIDENEIVDGDVVAIGGAVTVDGQVTGSVVGIGGAVRLGPHADIGKDVAVIGGSVDRDEGARIGGKLNQIGSGNIDLSGWRFNRLPSRGLLGRWGLGSLVALSTTVARLIVLCVFVSIVMLVGGDYVERVGARAAAEPLKAGLVGVLAQLLFLPGLIMSIMVLVVTIIGIPLLALIPFVLLALALVFLVGFAAVAYDVGQLISTHMGWPSQNPYATSIIGIVAVLSPILAGRLLGLAGGLLFPLTFALGVLGFLLEYIAWTVGFGAVALSRFGKPVQG
jgi:hypothetical protein